jgi:hypothetical protein
MNYPTNLNTSLLSGDGEGGGAPHYNGNVVVTNSSAWNKHYFQIYLEGTGTVDIQVSVDGTNYGSPPNIQMTGSGGNQLTASGGFYLEGVWPYIKLTVTDSADAVSIQMIQSDPALEARGDAS